MSFPSNDLFFGFRADGKPVKPKGVTNLNGYSIFCEEMRKNGHIGKSKAELMQMWKELGQEEKSIYQNKAKEARFFFVKK